MHEDARLIGQPAFIYEMGAGLVDGDEEVFLTGSFDPEGDESVHDQIERSGAPALLLETYPGRLEYHAPWHTDRHFSHLFRGHVPLAEVEKLFADRELDLRLVDNGITRRRSPELNVDEVHVYHLIPAAAGKGRAVATHMRRRGLSPEETIAIGDSRGDLEVADVTGGSSWCERPRARPADRGLVRGLVANGGRARPADPRRRPRAGRT